MLSFVTYIHMSAHTATTITQNKTSQNSLPMIFFNFTLFSALCEILYLSYNSSDHYPNIYTALT